MMPVDVAAAVLVRPDGAFLLGERPHPKVYAGFWEFPGGKVEPGESVAHALARELREELGIEITTAYPWLAQTFVYPHATVKLHFFRVFDWRGEPRGREGQRIAWQRPDRPGLAPMLPANTPILRALRLPFEYAISNAGEVGEARFLARLRERLDAGLRLVQLREKSLTRPALRRLAEQAVALALQAGATIVINGDVELAREAGAGAVHLTAAQLRATVMRPDLSLVGASVHTAAELQHASSLDLDFVVLGPVNATTTHPEGATLGWSGFGAVAQDTATPVYAIGGMTRDDLVTAWSHGGQGVAMIRGAWA